LRYLEQCVADLKIANGNSQPSSSQNKPVASPILDSAIYASPAAPFQSPSMLQSFQHNPTSPVFSPTATSPHQDNYVTSVPATSPVIEPRQGPRSMSQVLIPSISTSMTASPALLPLNSQHQQQAPADRRDSNMEVDMDHEATAALLMLNADRRGTRPLSRVNGDTGTRVVGKGMSVRDLLST
jgi:hypothetical protein